jgi:tetratricopeptide (TPR) repeat protein
MKSRLENLLSFFEEDNSDSFTLYALGIEYLAIDKTKALVYFLRLLEINPSYLALYYQLAKLYISLSNRVQAEETLINGIKEAKKVKDLHTLAELQNLLTNLDLGLDDEL